MHLDARDADLGASSVHVQCACRPVHANLRRPVHAVYTQYMRAVAVGAGAEAYRELEPKLYGGF